MEAGWPSDPEVQPWFEVYIAEDNEHSAASGDWTALKLKLICHYFIPSAQVKLKES